MLNRKPKPDPATADLLAELDARLASLTARSKAIIGEIVDLESKGFHPKEPSPNAASLGHAAAVAMLDGEDARASAADSAEVKLWRLLAEQETIMAALDIGRRRAFRLRVANVAEITRDIDAAWHRNLIATAKHLLELRELAQERLRLSAEHNGRTGLGIDLPLTGQAARAAGIGIVGDAVYEFLQAAKNEGLI